MWSLIVLTTVFCGTVQWCIHWGNLKLRDVAPLDTEVVQDSTCFDYHARPLIMWHKYPKLNQIVTLALFSS